MTAFTTTFAMIAPLVKGRYCARLADSPKDVIAAQLLRYEVFLNPGDDTPRSNVPLDQDEFDAICQHVLVEDRQTNTLVACFRLLRFDLCPLIDTSYSAQFYDLSNLHAYGKPMLEVGRFCTARTLDDPTVLRLGWAMLTRYVDAHDVGMMFGCSSFTGTDPTHYKDALSLLRHRHLAPQNWAPRIKSAEVYEYAQALKDHTLSLKSANKTMPPLLRSYLSMGGWVSDHAVIDRQLGTFHVFTGVEIDKIPPRRAELLRADAL